MTTIVSVQPRRPLEIYPDLAAGVDVVSANADWTWGAYTELIPADTITSEITLEQVYIEAADRDAVYQLELSKGVDDEVIGESRFTVDQGFYGNAVNSILTSGIDPNTRVRARLASSDGAAFVATVSLAVGFFRV